LLAHAGALFGVFGAAPIAAERRWGKKDIKKSTYDYALTIGRDSMVRASPAPSVLEVAN
jgi:hypothetical protein